MRTENELTGMPAYNSGFALWGLTFFVETVVQGSTSVLRVSSCAEKPPLRQAPKRYQQA